MTPGRRLGAGVAVRSCRIGFVEFGAVVTWFRWGGDADCRCELFVWVRIEGVGDVRERCAILERRGSLGVAVGRRR